MKSKNLKKEIKQQLFNLSISTKNIMIFEVKESSRIIKKSSMRCIKIEFFPKQIFQQLKTSNFDNIKFPNVVKTISKSNDFFKYYIVLKEKNAFSYVFLIKTYFYLIKNNFEVVENIFSSKKSLILINTLIGNITQRKGLINTFTKVINPFIKF